MKCPWKLNVPSEYRSDDQCESECAWLMKDHESKQYCAMAALASSNRVTMKPVNHYHEDDHVCCKDCMHSVCHKGDSGDEWFCMVTFTRDEVDPVFIEAYHYMQVPPHGFCYRAQARLIEGANNENQKI